MNYKKKNICKIKEEIYKNEFIDKCKFKKNNFVRKRKVTPSDIILYELNKKGLSTKMEILNFNDINNIQDISSPGLFKQREKLNPNAFTYLIQMSLKDFYTDYIDEVKSFNDYILLAIDGSDFEIPNTPETRRKYNGKQQVQCARVTVSTCYDILNKYTLDTIIEKYDFSETEMAKCHLNTIKENHITGDFKTITIADRNYRNLSFFYHSVKNDNKFLIRIAEKNYKKERNTMNGNDDIIEIGYENNRVKYYKNSDPELYNYLNNGNTIKIRCVKIELETGETEYLLTNLDYKEFSTNDISELYNLRWKTELNYRHLKSHLKIECITSSKETLIKQDIYSQVLVANMLQAFINDNDDKLQNYKYKNKMKTNDNMATGIFKNTLIYILLEKNAEKRDNMMEKFNEAIMKYIVPIKQNRKYPRKNNSKNRYHINQRKTF